jgi:transcriptional regulator with XRE-family HTH domain
MAKRLNKIDVAAGKVVRTLRHSEGWSQTRLANKLGVSYQQVQKYEKGVTALTLRKLVKIALIFNLTTPELVERIEK